MISFEILTGDTSNIKIILRKWVDKVTLQGYKYRFIWFRFADSYAMGMGIHIL